MILLGSRLVIQAFTWLVTIQVSRLVNPLDYAVITTGMVVIGLCDLLAEAGLGRALVYRQDLSEDETNQGFTVSVLIATGLYAFVFLAADRIAAFENTPEAGNYLRVVALGLFLLPFRTVAQAIVDKNLQLVKQSYVSGISAVVQSGLLLGMVLSGAGYWSFCVSVLAARLLELGFLMRGSGWRPRIRRPRREAREILVFGMHLCATSLIWFAYSNADFVIVGRVAGAILLGYYGMAFQLITIPVQKITSTFNQVSYPIFCRIRNDRELVRDWYLRLAGILGFFGIPAMVGLALVARDAFTLVLGAKWLPGVEAFQVMSVAGAIMVLASSIPPVFNALGRPDLNLRYVIVCALLLPSGFYVAARLWGMIGVCWVWSTVYPLIVLGFIHFTRSISGFGVRDLLYGLKPVLIGTSLMVVAVWTTHEMIADRLPMVVRLVADILVGASTYAIYHHQVDRRVFEDLLIVLREVRGGSPATSS